MDKKLTEKDKKRFIASILTFLFLLAFIIILKVTNALDNTMIRFMSIFVVVVLFNKYMYIRTLYEIYEMEDMDIDALQILKSVIIPVYPDIEAVRTLKFEDLDFEVDMPMILVDILSIVSILATLGFFVTVGYEYNATGFGFATPIIAVMHILLIAVYILLNLIRYTVLAKLSTEIDSYLPGTSGNQTITYIAYGVLIGFIVYSIAVLVASLVGINLSQPFIQIVVLVVPLLILPIMVRFKCKGVIKAYRDDKEATEKGW